ncbi:hypothetical protein P3L10_001538 [Capsicum annuum]
MAMKLYSLLNFAIFFTILLKATAVDLSRSSEMKMMTVGAISMVKLNLLANNYEEDTCGRDCTSDADCSDGWVCRWCWWHYVPNKDEYEYRCSILPN